MECIYLGGGSGQPPVLGGNLRHLERNMRSKGEWRSFFVFRSGRFIQLSYGDSDKIGHKRRHHQSVCDFKL